MARRLGTAENAAMSEVWRCAQCGDVMGVYEPLVIVDEHGARQTSRAAEPQLVREQGMQHYHRACYDAANEGSAADAAV